MNIGERIKLVRKDAQMTLRAFGGQIAITNGALSQIETGRSNPSDQTIRSICREFGISEKWLRTGDGEMYVPRQTFSLDEFARQANASELELEFIRLYLELPEDVRRTAIAHFRAGLSRISPEETEEERHERYKREAREEAEEYYRELLDEKRREEEGSVFSTPAETIGA